MANPVVVRQPSSRCGLNWTFFSLRFMIRTRPSRSVTTKSAIARRSSDQTPSTGFSSSAYVGSRTTRGQALFSSAKSSNSWTRYTFRLSQHHTSGAPRCACVAMIRSR